MNNFLQIDREDVGQTVWEDSRYLSLISIRVATTIVGTDCVCRSIRMVIDADAQATALSIDGIGAYDHELHSFPGLPFVRATHVRPTSCVWEDGDGEASHPPTRGRLTRGSLKSLLFCLAIHDVGDREDPIEGRRMHFPDFGRRVRCDHP